MLVVMVMLLVPAVASWQQWRHGNSFVSGHKGVMLVWGWQRVLMEGGEVLLQVDGDDQHRSGVNSSC